MRRVILFIIGFKYPYFFFIGGKELQSYGLDVKTGQILYQCSMNKCSNFTKALDNYADIIILQRSTQVIRATDPYNGFERLDCLIFFLINIFKAVYV